MWILIFLLLAMPLTAEETLVNLREFSGLVDILNPDLIQDKYSTDLLNVRTDVASRGSLAKRRGSQIYNTAPLADKKAVLRLYPYIKTNDNYYLICQSSQSIFADTSAGIFTAIKGGLTANYYGDFTTANNLLYFDNGQDGLGSYWNGATWTDVTVANSTQMVSGKYIEWWNNRLWKFPAMSSVAWYSKIKQPQYFDSEQFLNVNVDDGDYFTGSMLWENRLLVTKKRSTWEIIESNAGEFIIRSIDIKRGCIYNTTMDVLNGYPVWVAEDGMYQFNGSYLTKLSEPIDNFWKTLYSATVAEQSWTETTAADFGTVLENVFIDTTSSSGNILNKTPELHTSVTVDDGLGGGDILRTTGWQEVLISTNGLLKRVDVYLWHPTVPKTATIRLEISSGGITGTQYSDISYTVGTSRAWYCFDNFNIKLTSGTTYRINVTEGGAQGTVFWSVRNGDTYPGKNSFGSTANDFMFKAYVYPSTPSYTSRIYDVTTGGATFIRWANMAVTESGTGNGTPNFYYVRTSTASATMSTQGWTQMSNNSLVISTQSTFAQYRIISNSSNTINDANVGFFGKGIEYPMHGCVHEDRYYLSVSTDSGSKINNVTLCYQKDGTWTIFNNLYSGPITALNNRIYYGDSRDTGHVFEFDVDGVYTDSGTAYTSRWQSKLFTNDIDNEKIYRSAWITADNQTGANLTVKYDTDYYDSWTTLATVPLTGSGLLVRKYPFRNATKGRQIQVEVTDGADTDYWNLHSLRIMGVLLRNR